jgi:hypothetical protein
MVILNQELHIQQVFRRLQSPLKKKIRKRRETGLVVKTLVEEMGLIQAEVAQLMDVKGKQTQTLNPKIKQHENP